MSKLRQLCNRRGISAFMRPYSSLVVGRTAFMVAHQRSFHDSRVRNDENTTRAQDATNKGTTVKIEGNALAEEENSLAQSSKTGGLGQNRKTCSINAAASDAQVVHDDLSATKERTATNNKTPVEKTKQENVPSAKANRQSRKELSSLSSTAEPSDPWAFYADMGVNRRILENVRKKGWKSPLRIQKMMIPELLKGNNVVASIETGQGKTGAFAIPIIQQVLDLQTAEINLGTKTGTGPKALVLTPSAELAYQIAFEFKSLAAGLPVKIAAIYVDGESSKEQRARAQNADIIIGTPGRVLSHILQAQKVKELVRPDPEYVTSNATDKVDRTAMQFLSVEGVEMLVLDEGDKLLDASFVAEVTRVWSSLPRPVRDTSAGIPNNIVSGLRQTAIVSATLPPAAHDFILRLAPRHKLMDMNKGMKVPTHIKQIVYEVTNRRKMALLTYLLRRNGREVNLSGARILMFCRTAQRCDRIAERFNDARWTAASLHSQLEPHEKARVLTKFSTGEIQILVATDIATRGLDIPSIDYVINYDVPHIPEDYVHRVGRTGRAGKPGTAITLIGKEVERIVLDNNTCTRRDEQALMSRIELLMGKTPENAKKLGIPEWRITGIERRKVPGDWADQDKDLFFAPAPALTSPKQEDAGASKKPVKHIVKTKKRTVSKKSPVRDYAEVAADLSIGLAESQGINVSSRKNTSYLLGYKTSRSPKASKIDFTRRKNGS